MSNVVQNKELVGLVNDLLDGELTRERHSRFVALLHGDLQLCRAYAEWMSLHAMLETQLDAKLPDTALHLPVLGAQRESCSALADDGLSVSRSALRSMADRLSRSLRYVSRPVPLSIFVATAILGALLAALAVVAVPWRQTALWSPTTAAPNAVGNVVARLVDAQDAQWAAGQVGTHRGAFLQAGQLLDLRQGLAIIAFDSGAKAVIQGPTQLRLESSNTSRLVSGKLMADVPEQAVGHRVLVEDFIVTDLGTRFGVALEDQIANVQIFQGEVKVGPVRATAEQETLLREGIAARFTAAGELVSKQLAEPRKFAAQAALLDRGFQLSGRIRYMSSPPASVAEGKLQSNEHFFFLAEREGFVLPANVDVQLVEPGVGDAATLKAGIVAAGARVSSYLIHMDIDAREQEQGRITTCAASIHFDQPVLAVIYDSHQLTATDAVLGAPQTQYEVDESLRQGRGLEPQVYDELRISADGRTIRVVGALGSAATDQVRILVASGEP